MCGDIPLLPPTSSWRDAYLNTWYIFMERCFVKHRDNLSCLWFMRLVSDLRDILRQKEERDVTLKHSAHRADVKTKITHSECVSCTE
jgi:hypothetical protein